MAGRGDSGGVPWRALAVVGACLAWAVDNNLTRKVSAGDPVQIAMFKGLAAGAVNVLAGLAWGAKLPAVSVLVAAGLIGLFGYGLSLTLFVLALRHIGTARTGAYTGIEFYGRALGVRAGGTGVGGEARRPVQAKSRRPRLVWPGGSRTTRTRGCRERRGARPRGNWPAD